MFIALGLAIVVVALLGARAALRRDGVPESDGACRVRWAATGVRIFSWISGIALLLAAVFLFRYWCDRGWLGRPEVAYAVLALVFGIALVIAGELAITRRYPITANAMQGSGIAIVLAVLYALHVRCEVLPLPVALIGMLIVTAAAVILTARHQAIVIAYIGLTASFIIPALLSFANSDRAFFSFLLLLDAGSAWIALRQRWPRLLALSVILTALYEWTWVVLAPLTDGSLALAAAFFVVLAAVGVSPLWDRQRLGHPHPIGYVHSYVERAPFERIAGLAALQPLLFAYYVAFDPNYGPQFAILFGSLLLTAALLMAIAWRGGPGWLNVMGGVAALVTFFLWLWRSCPQEPYFTELWKGWQPGRLVFSIALWVVPFVLLYLLLLVQLTVTPFAALLFFVFVGLALRQPDLYPDLLWPMLVLLAIVLVATIRYRRPFQAAIAIGFASLALSTIALKAFQPPLWLLLFLHVVLFAALFAAAWICESHVLALLSIPLYAAMVITAQPPVAAAATALAGSWVGGARLILYSVALQLLLALVVFVLFIVYPLVLSARVGASMAPFVAAAMAGVVLLLSVRAAIADIGYAVANVLFQPGQTWFSRLSWSVGLLVLAEALAMLVLLWRVLNLDPREPRLTFVASAALAFLNVAVAMLLPGPWIVIVYAAEAAALVWLFTRFPHRALLVWSVGLTGVLFFWLPLDAVLYDSRLAFLVCAGAMFVAAWFAPRDALRLPLLFSLAGLIELYFRVNIEIADYYHSTGVALNFDFMSASPPEDLTYTIAWAAIGTSLLLIGLYFDWEGARAGALGLLVATILKCFVHDLVRLGDIYRAISLFILAVSLVLVGLMLQKFVTGGGDSEPARGSA